MDITNLKRYSPASFEGLGPVMVQSPNGEHVRFSDIIKLLEAAPLNSDYQCFGCRHMIGRSCVIDIGEHCIHRARDYYKAIR